MIIMIHKLIHNLHNTKWNIGFFKTYSDLFQPLPQINWMRHNFKNKWFADPFILDITTDTIIVLAEEFDDKVNRGRLAKLSINRNTYKLEEVKLLFEKDTHLSYPAFIRKGEEIFIYPENSQSGECILYKYDITADKLTSLASLIDEPLTDANILEYENKFYLFSTKVPNQNSSELFIYLADSIFDKFILFQTIKFNENIARGAGAFFTIDNKIYRPAQICNRGYGKGIVFQQIAFHNNRFEISEINRIYPASYLYSLGLHTYNRYNGLTVIDGLGYRHPFKGRIIDSVINKLK